ncbi:hypothetical protein [Streptomyces sp. NPDC005181]|uniref:hypothetical protein n=1 Tax=Streptomyces sp. NPDC005181 TaxID=3156869 RepID=UPI0033BB77F9
MSADDPFDQGTGSILRQPKAVRATAGASVVAFMGIGLVDPILPSIAKGLEATPSQVSLLFTSYFLITAVAMLVTGFVFAAAAAPYLAPKIEEWSNIHVPFVVAAIAAVAGALVVRIRRTALTHEAEELEPKHATEDGLTVFAN